MSYESGAKRRRHKRIESKSRRTPETAGRWFLTLAKKPGRCGHCGDRFDRGAEFVFRFEPRSTLCVRCAERDREAKRFRASIRWERKQRVAQ